MKRRQGTVVRGEPETTDPPPPKKTGAMSPDLKRKLMQEAATPWRTVRQFVYGAAGFSASIGGITALTQLAAALTGQENALPLPQVAQNIGIDFGVVAVCLFGNRVEEVASADIEVVNPAMALAADDAAKRLGDLRSLRVAVAAGAREADIAALQAQAGQAIIVLGGPRKVVDDALSDAIIQQKLFADADCLIVPVRTTLEASRGAVTADDYGFVAKPTAGDAARWAEFVSSEMEVARLQGSEGAFTEGIVIALRPDGSVARRGVGKPPWKQVLETLKPPALPA